MNLLHPSERLLKRFADGELPDKRRRKVNKHLERCSECRATIASMRRIAAAAAELPNVHPADALKDRIFASRDAGVKILLPIESAGPARSRWPLATAAAIV